MGVGGSKFGALGGGGLGVYGWGVEKFRVFRSQVRSLGLLNSGPRPPPYVGGRRLSPLTRWHKMGPVPQHVLDQYWSLTKSKYPKPPLGLGLAGLFGGVPPGP